ncbi:hypothetical protein IE81DRAFT_304629 [Ceraceosorus guamensis]|uniref:Sas10 C-terminal domain-containing protein n=1 Tax=Ceraceosorus guamensis TaxID=1522189 RepID=A0A316VV74_9BASI|nr:hypothetical protein IE81DRAFT_304629 [Ceraceosorus guamensis]PWN40828.1 hypothetical protein IE81DRAFT_304629 [Ceraceosorus guamensis]
MARKGSRGKSSASASASLGGGTSASASVPRWQTSEDVPMDEVDAFQASRDRILLDDEESDDDEVDLGGGRTVLDVGADEEDDEDEDEEGYKGEEEDDEEVVMARSGAVKGDKARPQSNTHAQREDSDASSEASLQEETGWGPHKAAYYDMSRPDADDSDSELDPEEARELQLKEAKNLQLKARANLLDEDFGVGEQDWQNFKGAGGLLGMNRAAREKRRQELDDNASHSTESGRTQANTTATMTVDTPLPTDKHALHLLLAKVQRETPETIALIGDYADCVDQLSEVQAAMHAAEQQLPKKDPSLALMHIHHQTLLTYLTTLAFYFQLRSSTAYASGSRSTSLTSHPIIQRLVSLKRGLATLEEAGASAAASESEEESEGEMEPAEREWLEKMISKGQDVGRGVPGEDEESLGELDEDELEQLKNEQVEAKSGRANGATKQTKKEAPGKKSKAAKGAGSKGDRGAKVNGKEQTAGSKKKKPATALASSESPLAALESLASADAHLSEALAAASSQAKSSSKKQSSSKARSTSVDDFGDPLELDAGDAADKASKRRSLQFHTGQIRSKEARRGEAARKALGGDADIPYRDRERSRLAVEKANAARDAKLAEQARGGRGTQLDDEDGFGEEDLRDWKDVMGVQPQEQDGEDDYYDLIVGGKKEAKRVRREGYEAEREEQRALEAALETSSGDAHRSITRQIEKNAGLSAKKGPKSIRNPRVKQRKRFDKASKKLASQRAVYKGPKDNHYQGEASGISNAIKSRSFG